MAFERLKKLLGSLVSVFNSSAPKHSLVCGNVIQNPEPHQFNESYLVLFTGETEALEWIYGLLDEQPTDCRMTAPMLTQIIEKMDDIPDLGERKEGWRKICQESLFMMTQGNDRMATKYRDGEFDPYMGLGDSSGTFLM